MHYVVLHYYICMVLLFQYLVIYHLAYIVPISKCLYSKELPYNTLYMVVNIYLYIVLIALHIAAFED